MRQTDIFLVAWLSHQSNISSPSRTVGLLRNLLLDSPIYFGRAGAGSPGFTPVPGFDGEDFGAAAGGAGSFSPRSLSPASLPLPTVPGGDGMPSCGGTILSGIDVSGIDGLGRFKPLSFWATAHPIANMNVTPDMANNRPHRWTRRVGFTMCFMA